MANWPLVKAPVGNKIDSWGQWNKAFHFFTKIYTVKYPFKCMQLVQYAGLLNNLAGKFPFYQVYNYDKEFQRELEQVPGLQWNKIDQQLWSTCLHGVNIMSQNQPRGLQQPQQQCWQQQQFEWPFHHCFTHSRGGCNCPSYKFPHICGWCGAANHVTSNCYSRKKITSYQYSTNLRALQPQRPHQQQLQKPAQWPSREEYVPPTPLQPDKLRHLLCYHPQQHRVNYILKGLTDGFSLEYTGPISFWAPKNLPSAAQFSDLVLQHLNKEIAAGRMLGPFQQPLMPDLMCSPIGMVPKKDSTEMRMIMHLSYPYGTSINDFIDEDKASTHYQQFDDMIRLVVKQGRFCWLAKGDVKSAFKLTPIKYDDLVCLGIYFDGQYYVDLMLPLEVPSIVPSLRIFPVSFIGCLNKYHECNLFTT